MIEILRNHTAGFGGNLRKTESSETFFLGVIYVTRLLNTFASVLEFSQQKEAHGHSELVFIYIDLKC